MDPGLRRDDGWGVSRYKGATKGHSLCNHRQTNANLYKALQRDTHFVYTVRQVQPVNPHSPEVHDDGSRRAPG